MKRKTTYTLLAVILVIIVYGYEHILKVEEQAEIVKEGATIKPNTNEYFLPTSTTGQVIHHDGYSLSYNEAYEQAEWVAYELKKTHLSKSNFDRPYFEIDDAVKTGAASWRNYKNSGYGRGHLCPAGDKRYSKQAYDETFLTSNISPQDHDFNAGVWNTLEQKVRYWASKYNGVFVVTGGVLQLGLKTIGTENVAVPEYFYKVIIDVNSGEPKMIGFLMPNQSSNKPLYDFVVKVDTIEKLTGIDFFPQLDDGIEKKLESEIHISDWIFTD
ncbi:DNA/RNA non-specific endonuclease [Aestuariibaculum sediminum]|uniref:DNA/RNA non-specific endonuclease n=1 Tax=Aestuariibaculum sediminum TaxID=2770637 RepID=A0A8J6Q0W9_9FLAO|nr:DNA/RNA non-specific endonuclease [Aestuariibaculum sediminum]MBD0830740.1 DNA/RNA non-specific endonuclease [Aestuariibaculum sediminum]